MQSCKQLLPLLTLLGVLLLVSLVSGNDDTKEVSRNVVSKYLTNEKILGEGRAPERCSDKVTTRILLNKNSLTNMKMKYKGVYKDEYVDYRSTTA